MSTDRERKAESGETIAVVAGVGSCKRAGRRARATLRPRRAARLHRRPHRGTAGKSRRRNHRRPRQGCCRCQPMSPARRMLSGFLSFASESGSLDLVVYNAGGNVTSSLLQLKRSEFEVLVEAKRARWLPGGPRGCPPDASAGPGDFDLHRCHGLCPGASALHGIRVGQSGLEGGCARFCARVRPARHPRRACDHRWRYPGRLCANAVRGSRALEGKRRPPRTDAIADAYWALHRQSKTAWTHELDLRPFKEPF